MSEEEINRLLKDKKKALRKNDLKELAQICNLRGELLAQCGRYEDAISEHEEEREFCGDDLLGVSIACRKVGECYCSLGQFEEALSNQRQHLSLATACNSVVEQQRAWATIGRTYLMQAESMRDARIAQGALGNAEKAFLSSLEACATLKAMISSNSMEKLYMEMKARLYLNLALVYDSQDLASKCEEHLQRAVEISKRFQLISDLFRCYLSLSTIAQKHKNLSQAIDYAESAVKCAKEIKDKHLEFDALVQKGQVLTQLSDFSGGKHFFKKALKMGSSTEYDVSKIKKYYSAAKKMLDVSESLEEETDQVRRLEFYDQLGDGAAELTNYRQAIEFYENMLECCEQLNRTGDALIPIYISLAQTHMDDKNYAKAIKYFRKELHLRQGNSEQECRTWLNIAEAQEYQGLDYKHLQKSYKTAFDHARKVKHQQLMVQVLKSLIIVATYFKMDVHIKETKRHLHQIRQRYGMSEDDVTEDESQQTEDIEVSDISDLSDSDTDLSDQEEAGRSVENVAQGIGIARVARKSRTTRNEKGETPLHRAAIEGNLKKVQKLLEQGHPVNPRDFCGWLPIHEASNYDHVDVVEYLISHGAAVNDRGDAKCKGVTPLIDAAICGHVDMMLLLINKGANIIMKDDEGMTALDHLITWRESQEEFLTEDVLSETRNAEKLLQEKMRGLGAISSTDPKKRSKILKRKSSSSICSPDKHREDDKETRTPNKTTPEGIRSDTGHQSSRRRKSGDDMQVSTYKEAMRSVGSATQHSVKKVRPDPASSRPALLDDNELADDEWLIDDMEETSTRKRKRADANELFTTTGSRGKPPSSNGQQKRARSYENEACIDMDLDDAEIRDKNTDEEADDNVLPVIINPDEADVSDTVSETDSVKSLPSLNHLNSRRRNRVRQLRVTNFTVPTRVLTESCSNSNDSYDSGLSSTPSGHKAQERFVMRLKINVKDQLFLIPVSSRISEPTVMWLNQEVSQRYYTLNGLRPFLTLFTKDGAILSQDDDVTMLLSPDEELDARINGWDLPIITERYAQACKSLNAVPYENVKAILEKTESSGVLSLGNLSLRPAQLQPVLRAIQFQNNLREINLQGNRLADIGLESLARMIESLPILASLDLSYNQVTTVGLQHFSNALKRSSSNQDSEKPLQQLTSLVLDANPLGDACSSHICSILTCLPQLATLKLSSCGLTAKFIQHNRDQLAHAIQSSSLHRLDVSGNKFCSLGGELLLNCLISSRIVALDFSSTVLPSSSINNLAQSLHKFLSQDMCALEELYISDCHFSTEHGSVIGRFPACCTTLRRIHLSSNSKLQTDTLTQLLESAINSQLEHIEMNLCGIASPLDYLPLDGIVNKLAAATPLSTLVFTCRGLDTADIECLQQIWASKWAQQSAMTFKGHSVKLSVTDSS